MRIGTFARIAREIATRNADGMITRGFRELATQALNGRARPYVRFLLADLARYSSNTPRPVQGDTRARATLAARWLARAHDATGDGGLSYGYFPFKSANGWCESYPETTGYTIPTLLQHALVSGQPEYRERALQMATFVTQCQMPSGAIYAGTVRAVEQRVAVAFNTGMALQGLLAAYRDTGEAVYRTGARSAADFLISDIRDDGHFHSHGPFAGPKAVKTYTCLCAWPLFEAGREFGCQRYCDAALRVGRAVLRLQEANGWFAENCLSHRAYAPLLHTIGYTLQGLLELGISSGEDELIEAARRGLRGLLPYCDRGFLHGRWFADWQPAALSSCLTGAAQVAVVCYRFGEHTGEARYQRAADAVLDYLKALQVTAADAPPDVVGAIGGSFPLIGAYMPNGFPGWATKFFLDALLCQDAAAAAASLTADSRDKVRPPSAFATADSRARLR